MHCTAGFRARGNTLAFDACVPRAWPGFEIEYRHRATRYRIAIEKQVTLG